MFELLADTSLVIDLLEEVPKAVEFLGKGPSSAWLLHPVVEMEVLVGGETAGSCASWSDAWA